MYPAWCHVSKPAPITAASFRVVHRATAVVVLTFSNTYFPRVEGAARLRCVGVFLAGRDFIS